MSALAKPFIHPTGTIDSKGDMVNAESVAAITTVDATPAGNSPARYEIIFDVRTDTTGSAKQVTWSYATKTKRDTSLTNIKTLVSAAVS